MPLTLPRWLVEWIRVQPNRPSTVVELALLTAYRLSQPDDYRGGM
jgi:hypothetical protein